MAAASKKRTPARGRPRQRRPSRSSKRPRLLLIGAPERTAAVRRQLAGLRLPLGEIRDPGEIAAGDPTEVAVVVTVPEDLPTADRLLRVLRAGHVRRLLLVAILGGSTDADAARLYRAGAAGAFAWPDEARSLRETVRELLGGAQPRGAASEVDRTLEREIRQRLRLAFASKPPARIKVRDRVAFASGRVDRLWKKRKIDNLISQTPGIRSLALRDLEVVPSGLRDAEIARALRALLRGASSIEDRTLAVTVHDGHAVVTGTVVNDEEWEHTRDLVALSKGVRSVTDRTIAAPRRKRSDRHVARRIESALRVLLPESEEVRPAALGRVIVLRGRTPRLATKREAERIAQRDPSVERVVNKIEVEAP
jgi:osmotically-inducible protein OsmY